MSGEAPGPSAWSAWSAIEGIFHALLAVPAAQRAAVLAQACPDPAMRAEVESLLAAHTGRGKMDVMADELMAPLLVVRAPGKDPRDALAANDRYRIIDRIGGGGMGVVYRARDERLNRDVALKFLPPHLSADQAAKKRFLIEARAAAAIEHPNICTVHEIGDTEDGQLYIVMACYDGEPLDRKIARGPIPVADAVRITTEVARGLAKAHERGIVHRDIKPANVIITSDGLVKILDFGIAKLGGGGATQTVGAIGTLAYMSPEQAFAEAVDHRTDYWSLGVVLYEMLAGSRPFCGSEQAILMASLTAEPEPMTSHRADVPAGVEALIRRLMAKRPEDRFPDATALLAALVACTARTPAVALPPVTEAHDTALTSGGERRLVTIVTVTIRGADVLYERLTPERADRVLSQLRDMAAAVATQHDGIVNHFANDAFTMLFGVPTAHEDDPVRAVRAALVLQEQIQARADDLMVGLAEPLRVTVGIHTGAVVAQRLRDGDRRYRITGAAADVSARLGAAAAAGEILLSEEARRLVVPFVMSTPGVSVTLAGGVSTVTHRVLGESEARGRSVVTGENVAPFVGRDRERTMLADHLEATRHGQGHLSVVVGEAGAGKSRLVHEVRLTAFASGFQLLLGRCDAYGGTTQFRPFIEAAQAALGLESGAAMATRHDEVIAAVRSLQGSLEPYLPLYLALFAIPSVAYPLPDHLRDESLQLAMRDAIAALFATSAAVRPSLLVLEDWHWADEASRAALRQLAEIVPALPVLLVVTTRPDGAGSLPSGEHVSLVHIAPLDAAASADIARAVFAADQVAPALVAYLHERTGGNPFFLEEVCEALREEHAVSVREGIAQMTDGSSVPRVPDTVQGVLRTRMDRLDPVAGDTLRVASVIGREFTRAVLEPVVRAGAELPRALDRLKSSGLVQQTALVPEPVYRFKHALTQEVAYDSLLEHQRRSLHEAVGRAIEVRHGAHIDEQVERLAYHFSTAECWPEAVRYGLASADRAAGLSQTADALSQLERVEQWIGRLPDGVARLELEADLGLRQERLYEVMGLRTRQLAIVAALSARLEPHGPSERLAQVYLRQGDAFTLLRRFDDAEAALTSARRVATARGDAASERSALRSLALLRSHQMRYDEALAQIEQVMELAREAGDVKAEAGDFATMANILRATGQHARALAVLESALERTKVDANDVGAHRVRYGAVLNVMGTVHRELGNFAEAHDLFRRTLGFLPDHAYASFSLPMIAQMQLQQGDVEAALASYREATDINRRARYADGTAQVCRSVGELLSGLERHDEAAPYLREAALAFRQLEDRSTEGHMWQRLATGAEQRGRFDEARAAWAERRELLRDTDSAHEAEALEGIARADRRLVPGDPRVLAGYREALDLAMQAGDRSRQLTLHNALGILAWERGDFAGAMSHFQIGLRLCDELGDQVHEGLMLNSLAASLHRLGQHEAAAGYLQRSLLVTAERSEHTLRLHALLTLVRVQHAMGHLDEARDTAILTDELAAELQDHAVIQALTRMRAEWAWSASLST